MSDQRKCVIHPDDDAYVDAQGIPVCTLCFNRYRDERAMSDGQFQRRPFLRELIAASADNFEKSNV